MEAAMIVATCRLDNVENDRYPLRLCPCLNEFLSATVFKSNHRNCDAFA